MQRHLAYQFESTQQAARFYHDIKSGAVASVQVRFHPDNYTVLTTYREAHSGGFDDTSSQLDELSEVHHGREVAVSL